MSMADRSGFGPKREETQQPDGSWLVKVTPPEFMGLPAQRVLLTKNQMERYRTWREGRVLIQDALPELSSSTREVLMSGIGSSDFDEMFREED